MAATRRTMVKLVDATDASKTELSVSKRHALAVAIRLQVNNAATFLHYRLRSFLLQASKHQARYEGLYIEVDDAHGSSLDQRRNTPRRHQTSTANPPRIDPFPTPTPGPLPNPPRPE